MRLRFPLPESRRTTNRVPLPLSSNQRTLTDPKIFGITDCLCLFTQFEASCVPSNSNDQLLVRYRKSEAENLDGWTEAVEPEEDVDVVDLNNAAD